MIDLQVLALVVKGMELDLDGGCVWVTTNTIESLIDIHVCCHLVWHMRQQYNMFLCSICLAWFYFVHRRSSQPVGGFITKLFC